MKSSTISLIGVFTLIVLGLGALLIAPDTIYGQSGPSIEVANNPNPILTPSGTGVTLSPAQILNNQNVLITVDAYDVSGLSAATATIKSQSGTEVATVPLYDNGQQNDGQAGDGIFGGTWNAGSTAEGVYPIDVEIVDTLNNATTIAGVVQLAVGAGACVASSDCSAGDVCCAGSCATPSCSTAADCNDNDASTTDACDTGSCPAVCTNTLITTCTNGDNYCPSGCTLSNDSDCVDMVNPTVSFVTPATDGVDISAGGGTTYVVSVDAADAETYIDRVEFYVDAETTPRDTQVAPTPAASTTYSWVLDVTSLGNGAHTLTAQAYDGSSNSAVATRTVTVNIDTTAPVNVSITSPSEGATFASSTTFNVTVHAEDDSIVSSIELYSTAGGGAIATVTTSTATVNATMGVLASSIAYLGSPYETVAMDDSSHIRIPFISEAKAATSTTINGNCTTTTTTNPKSFYAVAYDDADNSTNSPVRNIIVSTSTTSCTGTNTSTGGSA